MQLLNQYDDCAITHFVKERHTAINKSTRVNITFNHVSGYAQTDKNQKNCILLPRWFLKEW